MADRTAATLQILDCPLEEVAAVLEIITRVGLGLDRQEYDEDHTADNQLALGLPYMDDAVGCGTVTTIAEQLTRRAPGASWEMSEEPGHGWMGDLYRHTPQLGLWSCLCDAKAKPVFDQEKVAAMIAASRINPSVTDGQLGRCHESALQALARTNADVILTVPGSRG